MPSEDNEADLGTIYLERDRVKKCVTKIGMLFAGAWAGEQLLVVSGTDVLIGKDLIEGQSWTMGVVLLITVGVVLLGCVFAVFVSHLPSWECTRDKRTSDCKAFFVNHIERCIRARLSNI